MEVCCLIYWRLQAYFHCLFGKWQQAIDKQYLTEGQTSGFKAHHVLILSLKWEWEVVDLTQSVDEAGEVPGRQVETLVSTACTLCGNLWGSTWYPTNEFPEEMPNSWAMVFENTVEHFHSRISLQILSIFSKLKTWLLSQDNTKSISLGNSSNGGNLMIKPSSRTVNVLKNVSFALQVFIL